MSRLIYMIGGYDVCEQWGIRFEKSKGLISRPKMKKPDKVDWPDYHGDVVDLAGKRVEARTITLQGWMPATSMSNFTTKWNQFIALFSANGTQRLEVFTDQQKPLLYEVYLEDELDTDKRWSEHDMVGTFTIKLREPNPVKKVLRHKVTTESLSRTLSVQMTSAKLVSISWGDGTYSEDLSGSINVSHQYPETESDDVIYFAIIAGVIEEISNFNTNGEVVWSII